MDGGEPFRDRFDARAASTAGNGAWHSVRRFDVGHRRAVASAGISRHCLAGNDAMDRIAAFPGRRSAAESLELVAWLDDRGWSQQRRNCPAPGGVARHIVPFASHDRLAESWRSCGPECVSRIDAGHCAAAGRRFFALLYILARRHLDGSGLSDRRNYSRERLRLRARRRQRCIGQHWLQPERAAVGHDVSFELVYRCAEQRRFAPNSCAKSAGAGIRANQDRR